LGLFRERAGCDLLGIVLSFLFQGLRKNDAFSGDKVPSKCGLAESDAAP
jgi:hypothetical protein